MNINLIEFKYYMEEMYKSVDLQDTLAESFFVDRLNDIWYNASNVERIVLDKLSLELINQRLKNNNTGGITFTIKN